MLTKIIDPLCVELLLLTGALSPSPHIPMFFLLSFLQQSLFCRFFPRRETWSTLSVGHLRSLPKGFNWLEVLHPLKEQRSMIFWCSKPSKKAVEDSIGSQSGHHWINDTSASRGRPHLFCALSKFPISFVKSKILEFLCKDFLPLPTFTIDTQRLQRFDSNCCSWWLSTHHPMSKNFVCNLGGVGCLLSCVDVGISKFAQAFIHFS